ncbi:MAG: TraR/DksA family transcriptional regulator [Oligoflexia bacterium]|nr:TraR/DksA family transcriptional regulator [Oligoflexia bacterium]
MAEKKTNLKKFKEILVDLKASLEKDLGTVLPVKSHENNSFADANDLATHDTDVSNEMTVKNIKMEKYREVMEALAKLDAGEYGLCEECGVEITQKRLEAYPTSRLCVSCQEELEREMKTKNIIASSKMAAGNKNEVE